MKTFPILFVLTFCTITITTIRAQDLVHFNLFASGLNVPVDIANAGDSMLYVVEKRGVIRLFYPDGSEHTDDFIDIRGRVNDNGGEQGLLGLEFHPDYPNTPYFYVNYTNANGATVIARFEPDGSDFKVGDPSTEKQILIFDQPFSNHNGGDLLFGPDGYLYIPTGDGGSGGDPQDNGQDLMTLLGKMLRIDVDNGDPYAIPPDNPFAGTATLRDEIWAYGLRNPWRCDFDPVTGDMFIGDVGQNRLEEVDFQPANSVGGENYGWRCFEGNDPFNQSTCSDSVFVFPIHEYEHPASPFVCASLTGGVIYRGSQYPNWDGKYFFSDFCTGMMSVAYDVGGIWEVDTLLESDSRGITSFGRDIEGEIYVAVPNDAAIYKLSEPFTGFSHINAIEKKLIMQNPVRNVITFRDDVQFDTGTLYDSHGRQIMFQKGVNKDWNVSDLASGIYILIIEKANEYWTQKIIKF